MLRARVGVVVSLVVSLLACSGGGSISESPETPAPAATSDGTTSSGTTSSTPSSGTPSSGTTSSPADALDLASVYSGTRVVEHTRVNDESSTMPVQALDGIAETDWQSHDQIEGPHRFVLELATPAKLDHAELEGVRWVGSPEETDRVHVALSVASAAAGPFTPAAQVDVQNGADGVTTLPLGGVTGRYVAVDVQGVEDPKRTPVGIASLRLLGDPVGAPPNVSFQGVFESNLDNTQYVVLAQQGEHVFGCFGPWDVDGQAVGRTAVLKLTPIDGTNLNATEDVVVLADDGSQGTGLQFDMQTGERAPAGPFEMTRRPEPTAPCRRIDPAEKTTDDPIETELAKGGKAIVYGIQFEFDKDTIKPESKPVLDDIARVLKAHADWKMSIDGHTDSVGDDAYNQSLSERRAKAVVGALVADGIDSGRLTSAGHGESQPIADNRTVMGRAQNRRVELIKE